MSSVLTYNGHGLKLMTGSGYVRVSGEKYVPVAYPYLTFEFSVANFNPTSLRVMPTHWTQISSTPNVWKLEITAWMDVPAQPQAGIGIPFLFGANDFGNPGKLISTNLGGGTCKLIDSGNFDVQLNGEYCESLDRTFNGCTGLTEIAPIRCSRVTNLSGTFYNCPNVTTGALDQYNWFNTYALNVANHSGTFTDCGSGTPTGAAELAQIPVGWGGTQVPASTLMTSARGKWKSNYDIWTISAGNPYWDTMNGVYLFTEGSVSAYAGVSMNRSRISKFNGLVTTQSSSALYFYPCFMQHTSSAITWAVTTGTPNGSLTVGQGNTDMPGTLDYSTYGPFSLEFGGYDPGTVYFCFLVTSSPISSSFDLSSTPYGVLYNSNFKTDAGLRWFV